MKYIPTLIAVLMLAMPIAAQTPPAPRDIRIEAERGALSGGAKVMTDHRDYSGQGFVAGFEELGAAARFSVSVPTPGPAKLIVRYSAGWGFQTVGVYVDGQKAADLRLAGTNGWDDWATASVGIQLDWGSRTVEIRRDRGDSGTINIDWIEFILAEAAGWTPAFDTPSGDAPAKPPVLPPPGGPATGGPALPPTAGDQPKQPSALARAVSLEAELCALAGSAKVDADHSGYTGLGFVAGFGDMGAAIRFTLPARRTGQATIELRYSAGFGDETVGLYVDGAKAADLRCQRTPGWDAWAAVAATLPLGQGTHIVEIRRDRPDTGLINLDSIACR